MIKDDFIEGVIDISPLISATIATFPGDQPFMRQVSRDFLGADHLCLSSIQTTVHLGAHADAPIHYHAQGHGIDDRSLHYYAGLCQVVSVAIPRGERILTSHVKDKKIKAKRVLFKTGSFPNPDKWNDDFNALSGELIDWLAVQGVILVGIDTPSVDPFDDQVLESHQALYKNNMAVLEGIVLEQVQEGLYNLIALPLKIKGADASPVRAVLVPTKGTHD